MFQLVLEAPNLCLKNCKSFHMHNISTPSRKSKLMSLTHLRPMFDLGRTRYSIDDLHLYLKCHSFTVVFQPFKKNQLLGLSVSGTLVENELKVPSLIYVNSLLVIKNYISTLLLTIIRKGVPAPSPF